MRVVNWMEARDTAVLSILQPSEPTALNDTDFLDWLITIVLQKKF